VLAGRTRLSPDGTRAVVGFTADSTDASYLTSHFLFDVRGGRLGAANALPTGAGTVSDPTCGPVDEGFASASTYFELCANTQDLSVRRAGLDGRSIGDSDLGQPVNEALFGGGGVMDQARGDYYVWNPLSRELTRVNLVTGQVTGPVTAPAPTASTGGLLDGVAAFGRWLGNRLVPVAAAKVMLQPGLALAPDGSRLYALGVTAADEQGGSTGVFVWDTASMRPIDHWAPTADLVSLGVSPDGRFVYAAGAPGRGPNESRPGAASSLTVFEAANGKVRLIAGRLDSGYVTFAARLIP